MTIEELLSGNEQFRTVQFKKNIDVYNELAKGQKPQVLWIGCSDSRLQTGHITDSEPGTLFIHRNIGNMAPNNDWNLSTVLEYGIKHLKVMTGIFRRYLSMESNISRSNMLLFAGIQIAGR
jgi:carbonic anhydrase